MKSKNLKRDLILFLILNFRKNFCSYFRHLQLCHGLCNTPFVRTFPRKSPENHGKARNNP
jgi:hypothetical protein